ncbi:MAG: hypothetical protein K2J48_04150 [Muribaculaceae bacterium]|nr:hypothetical protein [Muribaculaceae bacterium]
MPTRALEGGDPFETVQTEGKLTDLWLIAFDNDGNFFKSDNILENLSPVKFKNETGHKTYNITDWFQGADGGAIYKLYLVANLGAYTSGTAWQTPAKESDLMQTVLNFRNGETAYLLNHSNVKENGLPMACLNEEVSVKATGASAEVGKGLTVVPGGNALITGNLKFLCSKVRYTLLFDNGDAGFSHDVFGTSALNLNSASVTGVCDGSQTVSIDSRSPSGTFTLSSVALNKVEYPDNPTTYPSDEQKNTNLTVTTTQTGSKRAWQGVVYLPANTVETKPTTLNFTGDIDGKGKVSYTIPLVPNGSSVKALKAGKFYDIAARVTGLETIAINQPTVETDWNRTQLLYSLMQNLFLHVNPTAIDKVEAGKTYAVYYNTNGIVEFVSPDFGGKKLFEFDTDTHPDSVYINVNPDIPAENYPAIMADVDNYRWFEVKTGGGIITKRIDIKDLDLHRFLNITPDRMAINMSELVASGSYNNPETATEFEIETNVDSFWIEMDTWPNNSNAEANHLWVEIQDPVSKNWSTVKCLTSGATVTDEYKITPNEGGRKFRLRYEGLNNGYPIWEVAKQYKLNFKVANAGGEAITSLYQVDVVPSRDSYIIHVKSKNNFLSETPHCYIYQCLEVPSTYTGVYEGVSLANWPVAGVDSENDDHEVHNADVSALEYSFTGKIAFKGWDWNLNAKTLEDMDIDKNSRHDRLKDDRGWHHGHFIRFKGDWNVNTNRELRYNTNMDFFKEYREDATRCVCASCRSTSDYNKGWPGLITEKESDGWSKIELTGTATPGRALIIWTAGHGGGSQYPSQAGVRLFDFPSKEAWIFIESGDKSSQWFQTKAEADDYARTH